MSLVPVERGTAFVENNSVIFTLRLNGYAGSSSKSTSRKIALFTSPLLICEMRYVRYTYRALLKQHKSKTTCLPPGELSSARPLRAYELRWNQRQT